eukprot:TRINITY_DN5623_c0_g1_i1.p1 TRINITY_DN5623_c0_g1~~TRINITY_DN5623_c0_g1_i1.p1  ORF type:complete len:722 (+),score=93.96 TRINITY_DN5623_c0_g1_i1:317-2482(+)
MSDAATPTPGSTPAIKFRYLVAEHKIDHVTEINSLFDPQVVVAKGKAFWTEVGTTCQNLKANEYFDVPPHPLDLFQYSDRWVMQSGKLRILYREVTEKIIQLLRSKPDPELPPVPGTLILGPTGTGKSHGAYLAALHLACSPGIVLMAMPLCDVWMNSSCPEIVLRDLFLISFANHSELVAYIIATNFFHCDEVHDLCALLKEKVEKEKLTWISMFDQVDALADTLNLDKYPWNIISHLATINKYQTVVITSVSRGHTVTKGVAFKGWDHFFIVAPYTSAEFTAVCTKISVLRDATQEAVAALKEVTELVPLEVALCCQGRETPLADRVEQYKQTRLEQVRFQSQAWKNSINDKEQRIMAAFALMHAKAHLPVDRCRCLLDHRFLYFETREKKHYVKAVTSLILNAIAPLWVTDSGFDAVLSAVLESMTQDGRGVLLQAFIIDALSDSELDLELEIRTLPDKANNQRVDLWTTNVLKLQPLKILSFEKLLPDSDISWEVDHLFVPKMQNYPGADWLIWNSASSTLFVFRLSLAADLSTHSDKFHEQISTGKATSPLQPLHNEWKALICSGCPGAKMVFVWVGTNWHAKTAWRRRGDTYCHISQFSFCSMVKIYLTSFPCSFMWNPARVKESYTQSELDALLSGKSDVPALSKKSDVWWDEAYTRKPLPITLLHQLESLPIATLQQWTHTKDLQSKDEIIAAATFSQGKWEELLAGRKRKRD